MMDAVSNAYVLDCKSREEQLRARAERLRNRLVDMEDALDRTVSELALAEATAEVYDDVALRVHDFMGTSIETVGMETTRYARVVTTVDGKNCHLYIGDDPFGAKGERAMILFALAEDRVILEDLGKGWVVHGDVPTWNDLVRRTHGHRAG